MKKNYMLYIITTDIKDPTRAENFTHNLKEYGEYISFMPKCYFLSTENENRRKIYNELRSLLLDEDLFLISDTELSKLDGWITNSVIDWLKNK